ncbi:MAG: glycosyltransferase family 1 protein [Pseudomonadota bacterium]
MRICIITDAWHPQINGVVRTLDRTRRELEEMGHTVKVISPDAFKTVPCPTYPEIRLALLPGRGVRKALEDFGPNAVHISTEGPLGIAGRAYCLKHKLPFTTAFHTKFPEYVQARFRIPVSWSYAVMRWFHGKSEGVMVATQSIRRELEAWGITNVKDWTRGVDTDIFRPIDKSTLDEPGLKGLKKPVFAYVGRVAVEKNIGAFLDLDLPGTKLVVGDGPQRPELEKAHPDAVFVGAKQGEALSRHFAAADVFVFPSRTDTFGLVMLEALASGLPVAAFPVPGPLDVVGGTAVGVLDEDLAAAAKEAINIPRETCRDFALGFSWRRCAEMFFDNLAPFGTK